MNTTDLEYRMYGLVPYNISDIQKGIQFGHAVVEYMTGYLFNEEVMKWAARDKTFIILNGGTTSDFKLIDPIHKEGEPSIYYKGSLNNHLETLRYYNINVAPFYEPDLGNQLTAVVFLVDERVWNKEKYPDFVSTASTPKVMGGGSYNRYQAWKSQFTKDKEEQDKIVFLREFLSNFKLA